MSAVGKGDSQMSDAAFSAQAQTRRKSVLVAGLGAAFMASIVTCTVMMSNSSPAAMPAQAAKTGQCQILPRTMLVSTNNGNGVVRFREGNYLSPPITLTSKPQEVTFPLPRPEFGAIDEMISIEGNATNLVITSPLTQEARAYPMVIGAMTIKKNWVSATTCGIRN
jgi:hypothetical protein